MPAIMGFSVTIGTEQDALVQLRLKSIPAKYGADLEVLFERIVVVKIKSCQASVVPTLLALAAEVCDSTLFERRTPLLRVELTGPLVVLSTHYKVEP